MYLSYIISLRQKIPPLAKAYSLFPLLEISCSVLITCAHTCAHTKSLQPFLFYFNQLAHDDTAFPGEIKGDSPDSNELSICMDNKT